MTTLFPFSEAKNKLVDLIRPNLPDDLKIHTLSILDLHLRTDTLAMPNMTDDQEILIRNMIIENQPLDEIQKSLILEKTSSKVGIFRVLVRTHLNRQGVNHVSKGFKNKTLSPRILNFTDTIDLEKDLKELLKEFIPNWLDFMNKNQDKNRTDLYYSEDALITLTSINNAINNKSISIFNENLQCNFTAPKLQKRLQEIYPINMKKIDLGWCRIVLGITSGLIYLNHRSWDHYQQASNSELTYKEIHKLINQAKKMVSEYGYALAGSFFADLGGTGFVKDDTHVRACVEAITNQRHSPETGVKYVIDSSKMLEIHPRILDKLMYLAGSSNFYLIGVKAKNSESIKKQFLEFLKSKSNI